MVDVGGGFETDGCLAVLTGVASSVGAELGALGAGCELPFSSAEGWPSGFRKLSAVAA